MPRQRQSYRQHLPALDLSIERLTPRVPGDGRWYVLRGDAEVGAYGTLPAAQERWAEILEASGWKPETRAVDPGLQLRAEAAERWARNRGG
jgi:hypothetical protein